MKHLLPGIFMLSSLLVHGQKNTHQIEFQFTIDKEPIDCGTSYYLPEIEDSIRFEILRMYISHVELYQDEQIVYAVEKKHLLMDAEKPASMKIAILTDTELIFNQLHFSIGVDSLTSVSGAMEGDLDPMHGMYWTWQSGYVNVKLEGVSPLCPARNHRFQFHVGGYSAPANTLQKVQLSTSGAEGIIAMVQLDKLLSQIKLNEQYQVMSPNADAVEFARVFSSVFSSK